MIAQNKPAFDVEQEISRIRSYVPASTAENGLFVDALHEELLAAYAAGAQPTQPAAPANVDALDAAEQLQYLISTGAAIRRQGSGFYLLYEDLSGCLVNQRLLRKVFVQ